MNLDAMLLSVSCSTLAGMKGAETTLADLAQYAKKGLIPRESRLELAQVCISAKMAGNHGYGAGNKAAKRGANLLLALGTGDGWRPSYYARDLAHDVMTEARVRFPSSTNPHD